jgi:hypothetical protein
MDAADRELFLSLGLENVLKQIEQNPAMGTAAKAVFAASGLAGAPAERLKAAGTLLYTVASSVPDNRASRREVVAKLIGSGAVVTPAQVAAAVDFFKKKTPDAPYDEAELHKACGAGIKFTDEQIAAKVRFLLGERRSVPPSTFASLSPAGLRDTTRRSYTSGATQLPRPGRASERPA